MMMMMMMGSAKLAAGLIAAAAVLNHIYYESIKYKNFDACRIQFLTILYSST